MVEEDDTGAATASADGVLGEAAPDDKAAGDGLYIVSKWGDSMIGSSESSPACISNSNTLQGFAGSLLNPGFQAKAPITRKSDPGPGELRDKLA